MTLSLYGDCPVQWTEVQTKSLKHDYPLVQSENPSLQESIVHLYLEYLWLPETLMSLRFFIPSLQRLLHAASLASGNPTAALFDPILLNVRSCASKYAHDIPEIIGQEECGEEQELEESMIWYAFNHEKAPEAPGGSDGVLDEDLWRKKWLDRMEKRETEMQILLYMMKISISPPLDGHSTPSSSPRKRRGAEAASDVPSPESRLESFFDKLSMWQLMDASGKSSEDELHWTQRFCEDIVELCFSSSLPDQCSLLRSKVFPYSPFSDGSDTEEARSPSPQVIDMDDVPARQLSRHFSRTSSRRSSIAPGEVQAPERSLSRALAEDRELRRSVSIGVSSKRAFSREVSMSRSIREQRHIPEPVAPQGKPSEAPAKAASKKDGATLVESTPVKPVKTRTDLPTTKGGSMSNSGDVFVESTPTKTKPRAKSRR